MRLLHAYFTEGLPTGEPEVLEQLAVEDGHLPGEVADVLATDRFTAEVREDERCAHLLGIQGVPFFAIDQPYGVSGAQSSDLLLEALNAAWGETRAA